MGLPWSCNERCDSTSSLAGQTKYHQETIDDHLEVSNILMTHHRETRCCNVPYQCIENGLRRPRDGVPLGTDVTSLLDVDGDGVEVVEIVRAIVMDPPGAESFGTTEQEGGRLLYTEINMDEIDQSAVEVDLRADVRQVQEKLAKLQMAVRQHHDDLQQEGGKDTAEFLQQSLTELANEANAISREIPA
eukprot:gnl/MRDRNA2_/MRDRNA2_208179_c0_seq1.p1 gnl/MRDRNA2_/MRDRNA2_208179_c0~~gnl/MRDRNA2_/MRDRNA2_208179_c0_seq1.p1  ORF type:complete len:189 (-),score=42.90 gnl/MRDRNA2_/MRDRNA2_208179_c0_seq1:187-753(-)